MSFAGHEILRAVFFAYGEAGNVSAGGGERIDDVALAEDVAKVQSVAGSEVVIEPDAELVIVSGFALRGDERVVAGGIGQWVESEDILGNGIDERNLVVR